MNTDPLPQAAEQYLIHLRVERGLSENTLSSYRRDIIRYLDYLNAEGLSSPGKITESRIGDYLRALATGSDGGTALGETSVARALASIRGLHRYWAAEGLTSYDPAREVQAPKLGESLPKALSVDDITRLLETPNPATPLGLRDRALLEFLYATGARISEAIGLDVDDVHRAGEGPEGLLLVRVTGKGNKQRMVPVGSYARQALNDYLTASRPALAERAQRRRRRRSSPALFLNKLGGRLSRQSAWTVLTKTAEQAGISADVSPHTLRHSCATHLLDGGADVRTVQELLGHASVTTTQIYTKITQQGLSEQYRLAHPRAR
ncbi:site-specific tyrosine recombinase XerD [Nesterenkonia alba]|uniref:site-specific tyrosine recombinase XerD n=1 Tax=Nesterenkonia alba TaxID=515814 RepID=UPI0003B53256|nr:site-specific tyrosine recombinase XerD [Nesterenkonia alba]